MTIECPKCQFDNPNDTAFCGKCGTKLKPSEEEPLHTQTLEAPRKPLTSGDLFARRFQIIEVLGKGGMGKVYRAEDKKVYEEVALKIINPEISSDKKTIERFRDELKLARKIAHRNVCKMYDLNEFSGSYYITMEYIPGQDLKALIRQTGQLTIGKTLSIAAQVCEGLIEAHRLGIIHRDLKPSNIMIDREGNARIMDFGIARSLGAKKRTGSGMMLGTPEYMSPEQVDGKEADQRSDIYSMGIILYEMVTGRVPFEGETSLSIAVKQKSESPMDPSEYNIRIPEDLSRLILKCLNKTKSSRFQSSDQILAELSNIEGDLTTTERTAIKKEPDTKERQDSEWKNSIAVLPFVDLSPQEDQEYFCDGMAEELINSLTKIEDLRVVARTSAFAFKGEKTDIREIGQKLNVKTVLEGSVRKAENRLRILAQLINVEDGFHIWSDKFDRDMDDVFAIQDEISMAIVDNLKGKLLGEEKAKLVKRHTVDVEAYKLYLKGLYFWNKRSKEGMEKGMKHFKQAIELDPSYALAYCGLADSFALLSFWTFFAPKDGFPKAKALAEKALEIDGTLAEAHVSLAWTIFCYDWDWAEVEKEYRMAIRLNPGLANAHHWYSIFLSAMERHEEALFEIKKALDLDPLSLMINTNVGLLYLHMRHYDKAVEVLKKTMEMDPNFGQAHYTLAKTYWAMEKYAEAVSASLIAKKQGILWADGIQGCAFALSGQKDKARVLLQELEILSKTRFVPPTALVAIYAGLGEIDKAFEWMDKGFEERESGVPFYKVTPEWDLFRSDPRFEKLLKKLNLV